MRALNPRYHVWEPSGVQKTSLRNPLLYVDLMLYRLKVIGFRMNVYAQRLVPKQVKGKNCLRTVVGVLCLLNMELSPV